MLSQIWPVLCCLGASHAAGGVPCLSLSIKTLPASQGVAAEVRLRPVTAWLGLPLLRRLSAFFQPLADSLVQPSQVGLLGVCSMIIPLIYDSIWAIVG